MAKDNDLFFTCSLIDYIARKTQNTRADVVNMLGAEKVEKIYDLADIYHSDNIERVSDDFIREAGIRNGEFDNVNECNYAIPSYWDIGKVYKRLIIITEVCITRIQLIYWSVTWKVESFKKNAKY